MKTKMKALTLLLCAVLLVVSTVFVTMAFLTDKATVTNTFTFGHVGISMDEAAVNTDGTPIEGADRVTANRYHLIPGAEYLKDPVIYVDDLSEDCWLFVELNNGLVDIIADTTIEDQMKEKGWSLVDGTTNIYAYKEICSAGDDIATFTGFTLEDDADVSAYGNATIQLIAYAVQADGFDTAADAWTAAAGSFTND